MGRDRKTFEGTSKFFRKQYGTGKGKNNEI
jgi:hypothetical protein